MGRTVTTRWRDFVARKEAEAIAADIPALTTEIEAHASGLDAIGNAWSTRLFDGPFNQSRPPSDELPATSLVFVQSRDGNTGARNPETLGGGAADKHLIYEGLSRVAADAVLAGAETIRGGHVVFSTWHPELVALRQSFALPRHPVQIVATLRGLPLDTLIFNVPEVPVVLLTVGSCSEPMMTGVADRPWISTVQMPAATDLAWAFRKLRTMGIGRISCIGGRTLARQLLASGLVQDLYVTTSPKTGGEPNTPLLEQPLGGDVVVRKRGTGRDTGVVFEHIRVG